MYVLCLLYNSRCILPVVLILDDQAIQSRSTWQGFIGTAQLIAIMIIGVARVDPIPLSMSAVEDVKHAVAINGGITDSDPRFRFFAVEWRFALASSRTHSHVHGTTLIDLSIRNIGRSQVGVDMPGKDHVDAVCHEKRLKMLEDVGKM